MSIITPFVRRLWIAGADTDSIARALGTHRAAVAQELVQLDDEDLLNGLKANLEGLIDARKKPTMIRRPTPAPAKGKS